ncbi:hypothetical protein ACT691_09275 [Vibrio metschnikovii]
MVSFGAENVSLAQLAEQFGTRYTFIQELRLSAIGMPLINPLAHTHI